MNTAPTGVYDSPIRRHHGYDIQDESNMELEVANTETESESDKMEDINLLGVFKE